MSNGVGNIPVESGNLVKVEYTGSLESGEVFDSSEKHGTPLEFIAGAGMLIKGFDDAVLGMEEGEEKEITIPPEEAYGEVLDELVRDFPKESIPDNEKLSPDVTLIIGLPNGMQIAGRVVEVTDDNVKIDMNHPLAGQTLVFKIKVVEFGEPPEGYQMPGSCSDEACSSCGHSHECSDDDDEHHHDTDDE